MQIRYSNLKPGDKFTHVNRQYVKLSDTLARHCGPDQFDHTWTDTDGNIHSRTVRGGYTLQMNSRDRVEVDLDLETALVRLEEKIDRLINTLGVDKPTQ